MDDQQPESLTIEQLSHHPGLHVTVNLLGKTVGGVYCDSEQWVPGVIVATGALGNSITVKLDTPVGGGERRGLLHRESRGQDMVSFDDPARIRPRTLEEVHPGGVPDEIAELVRTGKKLKAIKQYRALNGATLDEARAYIAKLPGA